MLRWFLNIYASSHGSNRLFLRAVWELIRRTLMFLGDPAYRTLIHGKEILLPISHKLPLYVANCSYYDELPGRVSAYLHKQNDCLTMIDVGANVGDTILHCYKDQRDQFLAVEVNPSFIKYLKENAAPIQNFELVEVFCSSEDDNRIAVKIIAANGTASVVEDQKGIALPRKRLDTIVSEHAKYAECNFLKIDTDGSDFDVVRGAHKTITGSTPMILMECDIFNNGNYVSDFSETMEFFINAGYETVIAYDNLGYLFSFFAIKDYRKFKHALFHQLISKAGYFDLLILQHAHTAFVEMELAYFAKSLPDATHQRIAAEALNL